MLLDYRVELLNEDAGASEIHVARAVEWIATAINRFNEDDLKSSQRYVEMAAGELRMAVLGEETDKWHTAIKAAGISFNDMRRIADALIIQRGYRFSDPVAMPAIQYH